MPQLWSHGELRTGYIDSWWVSLLETWQKNQPLTMVISNLKHTDPGLDEALVGLLDSHRDRQRWQNLIYP